MTHWIPRLLRQMWASPAIEEPPEDTTHEAALDYCRRHEIDAAVFFDLPSARLSRDVYELKNMRLGGEVEMLRVIKLGRFGNAVIRCIHSIHLARKLQIPMVSWPQNELIDPNLIPHADALRIVNPIEDLPDRAVLEGTFFYCKPFTQQIGRLSDAVILEIVEKMVRPSLGSLFTEPSSAPGGEDLVIHLRAGDVFSKNKKVHPNYVQPPLAYYQRIVEKHEESHLIFRVALVFEDRGNPCIQALEMWLEKRGIAHFVQSGTLQEDLRFLLKASYLVCGYGTFGPIVCLISVLAKVFYVFRENAFISTLRKKSVQVWEVFDRPGTYIASGEWRNSVEQRALMIDYPQENLLGL